MDHFKDKKVHITNELIHNPEVNDKLKDMNVQFIEKVGDGKKNFEAVGEGDVVILPAFGASYEEMDYFDKKVRQQIPSLVFILFYSQMCLSPATIERGNCRYHLPLGIQSMEHGGQAPETGFDFDHPWKVRTRRDGCHNFFLRRLHLRQGHEGSRNGC